jgi:hypothetical protein
MDHPTMTININCNSNCFKWCPRSLCCSDISDDETDDKVKGVSMDVINRRDSESSEKKIDKKRCTII